MGRESCLHQLSPYIGKLKSTIANDLVKLYTRRGDFIGICCGSGAVVLEALRLGRNVFASDISEYAGVLTQAKLSAPLDAGETIARAKRYIKIAKRRAANKQFDTPAPRWVRSFFHPKTLSETKHLSELLQEKKEWFLLACLLGILHHQRPGFLSYPSSHLVPYLRAKNFPRTRHPLLYEYRDVEPRLIAKVNRAYRRFDPILPSLRREFSQGDFRKIQLDRQVNAIITSPPYMNALDYGRDNRLRLWFLGNNDSSLIDRRELDSVDSFACLMRDFAQVAHKYVKNGGKVVLVVGEKQPDSNHSYGPNCVSGIWHGSRLDALTYHSRFGPRYSPQPT